VGQFDCAGPDGLENEPGAVHIGAMIALPQKSAQLLTYVIATAMVAIFFYGAVRLRDAPIHECATGYCGKQGQPHTVADYRAFSAWQTTFFIVWPLGLAALYFTSASQAEECQMTPKRTRDPA
jgi:hypothetical protein